MADAKDRRTNMATSSVNAPPKKDGAGGAYTWGSATAVTDYEPQGIDPSGVGVQTAAPVVTVAPAVVMQQHYVHNASDFPSLGSGSGVIAAQPVNWSQAMAPTVYASSAPVTYASAPVTYASAPVTYAAAPVSAVAVPASGSVVLQNTIRAGSQELFDQSHPRNQFAKKPHVVTQSPSASGPAIDWSSSGMPVQVQQQIIRGGGGAAHVSPIQYQQVQQAAQIPLTSMRSQVQYAPVTQPAIAQSYQMAPKMMNNHNAQARR